MWTIILLGEQGSILIPKDQSWIVNIWRKLNYLCFLKVISWNCVGQFHNIRNFCGKFCWYSCTLNNRKLFVLHLMVDFSWWIDINSHLRISRGSEPRRSFWNWFWFQAGVLDSSVRVAPSRGHCKFCTSSFVIICSKDWLKSKDLFSISERSETLASI